MWQALCQCYCLGHLVRIFNSMLTLLFSEPKFCPLKQFCVIAAVEELGGERYNGLCGVLLTHLQFEFEFGEHFLAHTLVHM